MLTIWGRRNSTNVKKVLWCAEELKQPYKQVDAGGAFGKVNDPDYRALNPNGLVPTIQDGDFVLWESNAILRYLVSQYGGRSLYPEESRERAKIDQWMDWTSMAFAVPLHALILNLLRRSEPERDLKAVESGIERCTELFIIADAALAKQPYLGSDSFSLADMAFGPRAHVWFELTLQRPVLPHLQAWYDRIQKRDAFRKIVMIPLS